MMYVIDHGGAFLTSLSDERGDQPGPLGDADADHRDEDDADDAEAVEVLHRRREQEADPVGGEEALDRRSSR